MPLERDILLRVDTKTSMRLHSNYRTQSFGGQQKWIKQTLFVFNCPGLGSIPSDCRVFSLTCFHFTLKPVVRDFFTAAVLFPGQVAMPCWLVQN